MIIYDFFAGTGSATKAFEDKGHISAPRGSVRGTQGIKGAKLRSMIPYDLSYELCVTLEDK